MRLRWTGLRRPTVPDEVAAAVAPTDGERLLAWGATPDGTTLVAGRHRLYLLEARDGGAPVVTRSRPWHLVDSGSWSEQGVLRVTWVDREPPLRIGPEDPGMLPETIRERVQASVVLVETVDLGEKRTARVVVRRELSSGRLLSQAVLGMGVSASDPEVAVQVRAALDGVREQAGLD